MSVKISERIDGIITALISASKDLDEAKVRKILKGVQGLPTNSRYSAKKKKDKNAPKKALSAYMFFAKARRPQVKTDNAEMTFGEIGKELGRLWGLLSDTDKKVFQDQADEDKVRYAADMEKYTPPVVAPAVVEVVEEAAPVEKKPRKKRTKKTTKKKA